MKPTGAHVVFYRMVCTPYDREGRQQQIEAVLLYKRTQDAPIHPGYWSLFGGKVDEKDQDEKAALKREVITEKELRVNGLSLKAFEVLLQDSEWFTDVRVMRHDGKKLIRYFKALLAIDMDSLQLGQNPKSEEKKVEGEGLGWFTEEEIHHLWLRPEDRKALTRFFKPDAG
jgi:ADP-ribose pyrophosphatase YjhB (NUDIX family)